MDYTTQPGDNVYYYPASYVRGDAAAQSAKPLPSKPRGTTPDIQPVSPLSETAPSFTPSTRPPLRSANTGSSTGNARPKLERRTTLETQYLQMLLSQDKISRWHNICAHFFTWILLAGYLVFPATFTHLGEHLAGWEKAIDSLNVLASQTWLVVAAVACGIGVLGMCWLWFCHRTNYIWLINRIFLPGVTNALAGLISTLVNIYFAQDGQFSASAKSTTIVTGACSVVLALLFLIYYFWALSRVKARHREETRGLGAGQEKGVGHDHGGLMGTVMYNVAKLENEPHDPLSIV